MACVPSINNTFLKGWGWHKSSWALGKTVTCLAARVLGGLGPVTATLYQQWIQEGLWPVWRVVQTVVKCMMETWPQGWLVSNLWGQGILTWGVGLRACHGTRGDAFGVIRYFLWPGLWKVLSITPVPITAFSVVGLAMELHVFSEGTWVCVTLLAPSDLAYVGLITGVHMRMLLSVAAVSKSPVAALELTFKGFFT